MNARDFDHLTEVDCFRCVALSYCHNLGNVGYCHETFRCQSFCVEAESKLCFFLNDSSDANDAL